jgi:acyl carrier protein
MTTTFETLSAILIKENKLSPDRLELDAPLEDLGIDSLGMVELLWNIEDTFKIKLPSDPVELATLRDVVHYVDELVASRELSMVQAVSVAPEMRAT